MTFALALLSVVVAVLTVLVVGLLRSHALILRRLHDLGVDVDADETPRRLPTVAADRPATPRPTDGTLGRPAHDLGGTTPSGAAVVIRTTAVDHDTVVLFLSSDCATCAAFWSRLGRGAETVSLPTDTRLVIVTKGPAHESPSAVAHYDVEAPVVMSDDAWRDFDVPGSPYAVHVEGRSGRVLGEGTGNTWEQVAQLLARATGDLAFVGAGGRRAGKGRRDARLERDTDEELLAAGIAPGDPSLYRRADGSTVPPPEAP